ncbi:MAG: monovalent cation:proton antiporter-2 (CPA2) family protein [Runella sp.]
MIKDALIYLGTALVFVPIAKKLGIGSVLGYLIGGIVVGPFVLGFIGNEGHDVMHAAEFGVVMMLFVIGLELDPQVFWKMRKLVVGMGGLQMLLTAALVFPLLYWGLGYAFNPSLALAMTFAMSSTAIVLQTLKEKSLDQTLAGKSSFAVLLFQDIAVIPMLAVLPLLAVQKNVAEVSSHQLPPFLHFLDPYPSVILILAVGMVYVLSRFLVPMALRFIARLHTRELFTSAALFLVIGIAALMEMAGISAALGAFMAGVLLANSEFRHELESDLEPFKGLLLGIFFTAVGATINFEVVMREPLHLFGVVLTLMAIKWLVLSVLGRFFGLVSDQNILFAFLLSQIGEFGFVLLSSISQLQIVEKETIDFFMAVVTVSMILSPLFLFLNEKLIEPYFGVKLKVEEQEADVIEEHHQVILVGFGHFGSTLGRFLRANGVEATLIDHDSDQVAFLRKMGFKVFYGDGTRLDLLESAGAANAKVLISAMNAPEKNASLAELAMKHFPHLALFVRAKNRFDAYELMDLGVNNVYRESFSESVYMGVDVLTHLGMRKYTVLRKAQDFMKYDKAAMRRLAKLRHEMSSYISGVREEIELQEKLLNEDRKFSDKLQDSAWDSTKREKD